MCACVRVCVRVSAFSPYETARWCCHPQVVDEVSAGWRRLYGLPWHSRGRGGVGAHPCRPRIDPLRCALPGAHSDQPPAGRALGGSGLRDTAMPVPVVAEAVRPCPSSPLSPLPVRSARHFPIHQPSGGFLAQWLRWGAGGGVTPGWRGPAVRGLAAALCSPGAQPPALSRPGCCTREGSL